MKQVRSTAKALSRRAEKAPCGPMGAKSQVLSDANSIPRDHYL